MIKTIYRNNGNNNNWLIVQCAGRISNRAGIGVKVRAKVTVAGQARWQLREISGGSGYASQNALYAHFGLGSATTVDVLRVEWPSGIAQELKNVGANQFLVLKEPARLETPARPGDGNFQLTVRGGLGLNYAIETIERPPPMVAPVNDHEFSLANHNVRASGIGAAILSGRRGVRMPPALASQVVTVQSKVGSACGSRALFDALAEELPLSTGRRLRIEDSGAWWTGVKFPTNLFSGRGLIGKRTEKRYALIVISEVKLLNTNKGDSTEPKGSPEPSLVRNQCFVLLCPSVCRSGGLEPSSGNRGRNFPAGQLTAIVTTATGIASQFVRPMQFPLPLHRCCLNWVNVSRRAQDVGEQGTQQVEGGSDAADAGEGTEVEGLKREGGRQRSGQCRKPRYHYKPDRRLCGVSMIGEIGIAVSRCVKF